jgi:hypothetical protein
MQALDSLQGQTCVFVFLIKKSQTCLVNQAYTLDPLEKNPNMHVLFFKG